jgi:hypothetical protein
MQRRAVHFPQSISLLGWCMRPGHGGQTLYHATIGLMSCPAGSGCNRLRLGGTAAHACMPAFRMEPLLVAPRRAAMCPSSLPSARPPLPVRGGLATGSRGQGLPGSLSGVLWQDAALTAGLCAAPLGAAPLEGTQAPVRRSPGHASKEARGALAAHDAPQARRTACVALSGCRTILERACESRSARLNG